MSRERIRQIEVRAFEKVQKAVQSSTRMMKWADLSELNKQPTNS